MGPTRRWRHAGVAATLAVPLLLAGCSGEAGVDAEAPQVDVSPGDVDVDALDVDVTPGDLDVDLPEPDAPDVDVDADVENPEDTDDSAGPDESGG